MTNSITILNNKFCKVELENEKDLKELRSFLSFKLAGVEFTPAYQNGWNGITHLLSKTNIFMIGLLNKVNIFLNSKNIYPIIIDKREPIKPYKELDITEKLKKLKLVPRDYQERIVDATVANNRGIIRACTGSGKSLCAALMTAKFNQSTIIYVIGLNLLNQFHETFSEIFDEEIGRIGNGDCTIRRITIASIWSIGRALDVNEKTMFDDEDDTEKEIFKSDTKADIVRAIKEYKIHILDESHVATTNTINTIYKNINPERIYGLSGTPFKDDGSDLLITGVLGEQIINVSASELIEKGILAKPYIKFFSVPKMHLDSSTYQGVYKEYIVDNHCRNSMILTNTKKLLELGYAPLVLFKTITHGKILFRMFEDAGINVALLYGNDKLEKRLKVIQDFKDGKVDVIVASIIFDIGVDVPKISALVNAGGGKSSIRALQRIGRCVRSYPGKTHVAIVDFFDQARYLREHSRKRFRVYSSETGFDVSASKEMKV